MQAISVKVVRSRQYCSTDGFHIYGDAGTGNIDWQYPVTPRRILLWDDAPPVAGHLLDGHLMAIHLDSFWIDGHLQGTHLLDEHMLPAAVVVYETDPFVFGRFQHAVVMADAVENANKSGIIAYETVINSEPASASEFLPASYDSRQDRMDFSFSPSERLTG